MIGRDSSGPLAIVIAGLLVVSGTPAPTSSAQSDGDSLVSFTDDLTTRKHLASVDADWVDKDAFRLKGDYEFDDSADRGPIQRWMNGDGPGSTDAVSYRPSQGGWHIQPTNGKVAFFDILPRDFPSARNTPQLMWLEFDVQNHPTSGGGDFLQADVYDFKNFGEGSIFVYEAFNKNPGSSQGVELRTQRADEEWHGPAHGSSPTIEFEWRAGASTQFLLTPNACCGRVDDQVALDGVVHRYTVSGPAEVVLDSVTVPFEDQNTIVSRNVNPTDSTVRFAKLTAQTGATGLRSSSPAFEDAPEITYEMSADGGTHWEQVEPGTIHEFEHTGEDLRWRATLSTTNSKSSPILDQVQISVDPPPKFSIASPTKDTIPDETVTLDVSNAQDVSSWTYTLDQGSQTSFTPPSQLDLEPGDHTLTVKGTDHQGQSASQTASFHIDHPPTADFTPNPSNPTVGESVTLDAAPSSDPDDSLSQFEWQVEGSGAGTGQSIDHTFETAGDHDVQLTVTDPHGRTDTTTKTLTVQPPNQPPQAHLDASSTELDPGSELDLDASSSLDPDGSITAYTWILDGSEAGTGSVLTVEPQEPGPQMVELTVTDDDGATDTATRTVTVHHPPEPAIEASVDDCRIVSLDATKSSDADGKIASYRWQTDGETIGEDPAIRRFLGAGEVPVELTVTDDDGLTGSATQNLDVPSWAVPQVEPVQVPGIATIGDPVTFQVSNHQLPCDSLLEGFAWTVDGETVAKDERVEHTFEEPGDHRVRVDRVLTTGQHLELGQREVQVQAPQQPTASFTNTPEEPSEGQTVEFDASASSDPDGPIESYDWHVDGEAAGSGPTLDHIFDEPGAHSVELTVTDDDGQQATATKTVEVTDDAPPTAEFTAGPAETATGQTVSLDASDSQDDDQIVDYAWTVDEEPFGAGPTLEHTFEETGTYEIQLQVEDSAGQTASTSRTVTVEAPNQAPTAALAVEPKNPTAREMVTLEASQSSDPDGSITAYDWRIDGEAKATGPFLEHTFSDPGAHELELTVTDDRGATDTATRTIAVEPDRPQLPTPSIPLAIAGEDERLQLAETQRAIDLWAEDEPVPGTDSATIDLRMLQQIIDVWAEDRPVHTIQTPGAERR